MSQGSLERLECLAPFGPDSVKVIEASKITPFLLTLRRPVMS